jgi:hypothetical protein
LVLQAQEVFQKFLIFQVAKEMSILQADTTLTDEEKAVAGSEQGLAYSGIGRLLKCPLRDLTGTPAPHGSFLSFCGIPMLLKMKKKKPNKPENNVELWLYKAIQAGPFPSPSEMWSWYGAG